MCQSALAISAVLILVGGSSGRRGQTLPDLRSPFMAKLDPAVIGRSPHKDIHLPFADDDPASILGDSYHAPEQLFYLLTNAESTEEQQGYTYNSYYAPSTVNFHDIYSNSLALLAEEPIYTTMKEDESFHLNNLPTKFVEFHPKTQTIPPSTSPRPMFLLKASMLKNKTEDHESEEIREVTTTTSTTSTTTEEPEEFNIKVIPIKRDYQRGVLDLLFPAARVRTFKSVFDTFRRLMSHTFR